MHGIERIRTDVYEQCLHEALNFSANSRHIAVSILSGLADGLLKLAGGGNHRSNTQGVKTLLLDCYDKYWRQLAAPLSDEPASIGPLTKRDSLVVHELLNDRTRLMYRRGLAI